MNSSTGKFSLFLLIAILSISFFTNCKKEKMKLVIKGNETNDIIVTISLSMNKSFEWTDNGNGVFEPLDGNQVVDMGIREMIPKW